jgi:hypothetical protein
LPSFSAIQLAVNTSSTGGSGFHNRPARKVTAWNR